MAAVDNEGAEVRAETEQILQMAGAEAERRGAAEPGLDHLAYVMSSLWPVEFDNQFGKLGRVLLEGLLTSGARRDPIASAPAILAAMPRVDAALRGLHIAMGFPAAGAAELEREAHSRWLDDLINERFASYSLNPTTHTLDELYVLIGTLKIVGFEESYRAMKAKISKLEAPLSKLRS